ncbi:cellulose biosynthesis cyclic di-GMP-binding regulatory protein BcsB [Crassaminicella thermophila]|uniref:Cellulose biosynthesis cyclic di-GMP-binding regulatory protein BcsB n=1 Tax=Crassaminicella thermophila TaxID=2599308 RepID=A0A5C0SE56_CRATE|nr:cellulose biosynthesis cyclic di-GMP-binding regulatory protein BcsB [Crassaminicella thermophila]QEK12783.1 cellulose biosynthesis cyclic di-GMP-binding regulatory protein BcsB [Crassaminicella thermophila]
MIKKSIGLLIIICIIMSSIFSNGEAIDKEPIKNYRFNQDVQFKGVFGGYTFFFYVDKYWKLKDEAFLELIFSQSDIKEYKSSTLNVYLNDFPIKSIKLFDKGVNNQIIRIKLPIDKIINDYNAIKFKIYHRITDEPCTDEINPANWLVLHKNSYVHIVYEEKVDSISLKEYPYPYFISALDQPVKTVITLPLDATSGQITAAMKLAADFGRRAPFKNLDLTISPFYELLENDKKNNNIIHICNTSNLPKEFLKYISDEERAILKERAMIKEVISPYNSNKRLLLIISDDDERLINVVQALGDNKLILQMKDNTQYINYIHKREKDIITNKRKITLKDFGYDDRVLEGIFFQQASYGVNIPKGRILKEDASVNIFMRYSKTLNFDKSSVTVYLNDIPIGDKELSYKKSDNDCLSIKIPKKFRKKSYLELKIVFYLEPKNYNCYGQKSSNIWAVILNESNFDLPYEFTNERFLEYYPSPFVRDGKFNDFLFVLPEKINRHILSMAGNIFTFMGHNINALEDFKVIKANELKESYKQKNMILLGTPKGNRWIAKVNEYLNVPFDKKMNRLIGNEKIPLLDKFCRNAATIQIIKSPWNESKSLMVVSGVEEKNIKWAEAFLKEYELILKLKGDAVVIDNTGNIYTGYYAAYKKDLKEVEKKGKIEIINKIKNPQFYLFILFLISLGIMILIGTIVIVRRNK